MNKDKALIVWLLKDCHMPSPLTHTHTLPYIQAHTQMYVCPPHVTKSCRKETIFQIMIVKILSLLVMTFKIIKSKKRIFSLILGGEGAPQAIVSLRFHTRHTQTHTYTHMNTHAHTNAHAHVYTHIAVPPLSDTVISRENGMGWLRLVGSIKYRSVVPNIVSFVGLFCQRDL